MLLSMRTRQDQAATRTTPTSKNTKMYYPNTGEARNSTVLASDNNRIKTAQREQSQMRILKKESILMNKNKQKQKTEFNRIQTKELSRNPLHKSNCNLSSGDIVNILKSRSAENLGNENREKGLERVQVLRQESSLELPKFIAAQVSPIMNRRNCRTPQLPRIRQLKLGERRRSRSVQELSTQQRASLERVYSSVLSFKEENQAWSSHWQLARQGIIRKDQGLPSIGSGKDSPVQRVPSRGSIFQENETDSEEEDNETALVDTIELSLEERLALIEIKQGIIH